MLMFVRNGQEGVEQKETQNLLPLNLHILQWTQRSIVKLQLLKMQMAMSFPSMSLCHQMNSIAQLQV